MYHPYLSLWILVPSTHSISSDIVLHNFCRLTNGLVYYGLSLNSSDLDGDDFVNFSLSGLVEIPAYILGILLQQRFARRWTFSAIMAIAGVCLLCTGLFPKGIV